MKNLSDMDLNELHRLQISLASQITYKITEEEARSKLNEIQIPPHALQKAQEYFTKSCYSENTPTNVTINIDVCTEMYLGELDTQSFKMYDVEALIYDQISKNHKLVKIITECEKYGELLCKEVSELSEKYNVSEDEIFTLI